jgi:hypothetical protein
LPAHHSYIWDGVSQTFDPAKTTAYSWGGSTEFIYQTSPLSTPRYIHNLVTQRISLVEVIARQISVAALRLIRPGGGRGRPLIALRKALSSSVHLFFILAA